MNYPKMLYKGSQNKYQHIIADDAGQEELLIDDGWKEYADLPEFDESTAVGAGAPNSADKVNVESFITQERFDLSTQELVEVKQDLATAKTETEPTDLTALTTEQLREMVTAQGKTFKQRDSKPELIAILES